jgi:3'-5' exoribonuclease
MKLVIKTLTTDTKYDGILMVKAIEPKNGKVKPYYRMVLGDGETDLEATYFDELTDYKSLQGKILRMEIKTQVYNGKFCCLINMLDLSTEVSEELKSEFIKFSSSPKNYKQNKDDLVELINTIKDNEIKKLCHFVFLQKYKQQFETIPAGKTNHHTGCGGLLEHSLSLAKLGLACANHYTYDHVMDTDLIIAGALFQDIGKVFEFDVDDLYNVKYSKLAALKGHIIIGDEILYDSLHELKIVAEQDKFARLSHIILSHQSLLEYGSPVLPCIPEAVLISKLDKLDSEIKSTFMAIHSTREDEDFSQRLMTLQNAAVLLPTTTIYSAPQTEDAATVVEDSMKENPGSSLF